MKTRRRSLITTGQTLLVIVTTIVAGCNRLEEGNSSNIESACVGEHDRQVHHARSDCNQCHRTRRNDDGSSRVQLTAGVPGLCHQCHDVEQMRPAGLDDMVHGEDCLFCHAAHSNRGNLLRTTLPKLCYNCHEVGVVQLVAEHSRERDLQCDNCHKSHPKTENHFLITTWQDAGADH